MSYIEYVSKKFSATHREIIDQANEIIEEYAALGYDLTLRQLYYQFVSRDVIPNNDREYKRLGNIISDARRAGLVDWSRIVDRTRFLRTESHWDNPQQIVESCAAQFNIDWWDRQRYRPEVWVEKDALIGVLEVVCKKWHIPYFSCRGYVSDSEMWSAAQRCLCHCQNGQRPVIYHLGDHDPSGIDMTRDIQDRMNLFTDGFLVQVNRIALLTEQIRKYAPPPNPAKMTDVRFQKYSDQFGDSSWELDALNPTVIGEIIDRHIQEIYDEDLWRESEIEIQKFKEELVSVHRNWDDVLSFLRSE